ncbi:MAG: M48 family peptidase, partial [Congregibacter sp.]|nr:M48 family peptidase [Congregibacter sp.]
MLMTANKPTQRLGGLYPWQRRLVTWVVLSLLCNPYSAWSQPTEKLKIPNLGESSTSLFSAEYEYQLGRAWLRVFRSKVATVNDPLLFSYL